MRFRHLHMYIHRIALSVVLPPRPRPLVRKQLESPTTLQEHDTFRKSPSKLEGRLPPPANKEQPLATKCPASNCRPGSRKLLKQTTFALGFSTAGSSGMQGEVRLRSESLDLSPSLINLNTTTEGKGLSQVGKSRRAQLSKQQSIYSVVSDSVGVASEGGRASSGALVGRVTVDPSTGERLWRGLRLDLLRSRIQRLIVVMNTSEPGSIPDAGMLASLVDLVSFCCVDHTTLHPSSSHQTPPRYSYTFV